MNTYNSIYSTTIPDFGTIDFRPLQLDNDAEIIHDWVNRDYAQYWGMQGKNIEEVRSEYEKITKDSDVFIGLVNGDVSFLIRSPKKALLSLPSFRKNFNFLSA